MLGKVKTCFASGGLLTHPLALSKGLLIRCHRPARLLLLPLLLRPRRLAPRLLACRQGRAWQLSAMPTLLHLERHAALHALQRTCCCSDRLSAVPLGLQLTAGRLQGHHASLGQL